MSIGGREHENSDNNSDHGRVYKCLKAATVDYRFRPGVQIMVAELAERLRVSSTPVRETLIRLQAEALLETTARRGFFAKTLNLKEMIDLVQMRFLILKSSIELTLGAVGKSRKGGAKSTPAASDSVGAAASACAVPSFAASLPDDAVQYVEKADEAVVALSQNDVMTRALANLNDRTHYVRMLDIEAPERASVARSMVGKLSAALIQKDCAAAITILKRARDEHIERMPALVKEGISRAYTSPSWIAMPSRADANMAALRKPMIAGRVTFTQR